MNKKQKKMLYRIIIATVLLIGVNMLPLNNVLAMSLYLVTYLVIGYDILKKAGKGILNGQVFDENFLMAVATVGAIVLAFYEKSGDFNEAIAVMLFYQIGELFQSYAVGKSRKNISALMDIRPDYANIEQDGKLVRVDPDEVTVGSIIVVQPGEKVPIDGTIVEGSSSLNTSALTGESLPREAGLGDEVISGCYQNTNHEGVWRIYRIKNFRACGRIQFKKVQIGKLYFQICKGIYPGSLLCCISISCSSTSYQSYYGKSGWVDRVDIQSVDVPGYQLSMCTGY